MTTILGLSGRSWKWFRKLIGSAAMCISSATRSTTCLARSPTTAWWNCAGSTIGATPRKPAEISAAWLLRWQEKYPRLCAWVEENIEETLTFYRLPREHHKHLKSTNMLERINQETQAPHPCHPHLSQRGERPAADPGAGGRNPRGLDRSPPLPQHGNAARTTQTTSAAGGRLK